MTGSKPELRTTPADTLKDARQDRKRFHGQMREGFSGISSSNASLSGTNKGAQAKENSPDYLKRAGDSMNGPVGLNSPEADVEIDVLNTINIGNDTETFSSNILVFPVGSSDLDIIAGAAFDGQLLYLKTFGPGTFTIRQSTLGNGGNIQIDNETDFLVNNLQVITLIFDSRLVVFANTGGTWRVITKGDVGGGSNVPDGTAQFQHLEWGGAAWIAQQELSFGALSADAGQLKFPNDVIFAAGRTGADDGNIELKFTTNDELDITNSNESTVAILLRAQHTVDPDNLLLINQAPGTLGNSGITASNNLFINTGLVTTNVLFSPASALFGTNIHMAGLNDVRLDIDNDSGIGSSVDNSVQIFTNNVIRSEQTDTLLTLGTDVNFGVNDAINIDRLQISGGTISATGVNDVVWYLSADSDLVSNIGASDTWIWSSGNIIKMILSDSTLEKRNVTAPVFQLYNTRAAQVGTAGSINILANSTDISIGASMGFLVADTEAIAGDGRGSLKLGVNLDGTPTLFLTMNEGNDEQLDILKETDFNAQDVLGINRLQLSGGTISATSPDDVVWYLTSNDDLVSNIGAGKEWGWSSDNVIKMVLSDNTLEKRNVTAPVFQLYNTRTAAVGTAGTMQILANTGNTSTGIPMGFIISDTEVATGDGSGSLKLGVNLNGTPTLFMTMNDNNSGDIEILTDVRIDDSQAIRAESGGETGFFVTDTSVGIGTAGSNQIPVVASLTPSAANFDSAFGSAIGCVGMYNTSNALVNVAFKNLSGTWVVLAIPDNGGNVLGDHIN